MTKEECKQIRLDAHLTQAQLATYLGLSGSSRISEYEKGTRNPSPGVAKLYELIRDKKIKVGER